MTESNYSKTKRGKLSGSVNNEFRIEKEKEKENQLSNIKESIEREKSSKIDKNENSDEIKSESDEQGIPQNQMINDINEFQKNNPNLKKMNFEDLMKNANNNFEKEKKSEPYDINMILNKKGDKEDSEENDK